LLQLVRLVDRSSEGILQGRRPDCRRAGPARTWACASSFVEVCSRSCVVQVDAASKCLTGLCPEREWRVSLYDLTSLQALLYILWKVFQKIFWSSRPFRELREGQGILAQVDDVKVTASLRPFCPGFACPHSIGRIRHSRGLPQK